MEELAQNFFTSFIRYRSMYQFSLPQHMEELLLLPSSHSLGIVNLKMFISFMRGNWYLSFNLHFFHYRSKGYFYVLLHLAFLLYKLSGHRLTQFSTEFLKKLICQHYVYILGTYFFYLLYMLQVHFPSTFFDFFGLFVYNMFLSIEV